MPSTARTVVGRRRSAAELDHRHLSISVTGPFAGSRTTVRRSPLTRRCVAVGRAGNGARDPWHAPSGAGRAHGDSEETGMISRNRARLIATPALIGALGLGVLAGC